MTATKTVTIRGQAVHAAKLVRAASQQDAGLAAEYRAVVQEAAGQILVALVSEYDGGSGNTWANLALTVDGETVRRSEPVRGRTLTPDQYAAAKRDLVKWGVGVGLGGAKVADSRGVEMDGFTLADWAR